MTVTKLSKTNKSSVLGDDVTVIITWSTVLSLINEENIILVRQIGFWDLELP